MKSNLDIIKECDNFPYYEPGNTQDYTDQVAELWHFFLPDDPRPHGFVLDSVARQMPWTSDFRLISEPRKEIHLLRDNDGGRGGGEDQRSSCTRAIDKLLDIARETNVFPRLGRKRDEVFPIIGADFDVRVERSAISLFGIVGRGVHMTVYTRTASGMKFWIPRRSWTKSTYPGMLDNTVAGGCAAGEEPFECLVRESEEEAALSEDLVRGNARPGGTVTWFNISDEKAGGEVGLMNPGILYVYDLEVGEDVVFEPVEGDIHAFHLMDQHQVMQAMARGEFKPASASVIMDFLVRHGFITAENEMDYVEIVSRLHRKLPFPTSPSRHSRLNPA